MRGGCATMGPHAMRRIVGVLLSTAATLALLGVSGATAASPCGRATTPPATYEHVVWVVMENKPYSAIIGSPTAPYINRLRSQCGSATRFFAEAHPSLPNYIAMTSGSTQGITDDGGPSAHPLNVPSIFSQVGRLGWRSLEESMTSNCLLASPGEYAVRHNPAAYYTNVQTACASRDVPLGVAPNISARFTFVTPNLCNDTHDCNVSTGDTWLKRFLPKLFARPAYRGGRTAVFVTWDEDDHSQRNQIATLVIAPSVGAATTSAKRFNHYSMLRTTEQLLGLGFLGNAARAASMRGAFGI